MCPTPSSSSRNVADATSSQQSTNRCRLAVEGLGLLELAAAGVVAEAAASAAAAAEGSTAESAWGAPRKSLAAAAAAAAAVEVGSVCDEWIVACSSGRGLPVQV
jgi:hypothetical protein